MVDGTDKEISRISRVSLNVRDLIRAMGEFDENNEYLNKFEDRYFMDRLYGIASDIRQNGLGGYTNFLGKCQCIASTADETQYFDRLLRFVRLLDRKILSGEIVVQDNKVGYAENIGEWKNECI